MSLWKVIVFNIPLKSARPVSYTHLLFALKEFGPKEVVATTYQAISGAGKTFKDWPEMVENIIPFIGGEEEKSEQEPLRLFGKVVDGKIEKAAAPLITTQLSLIHICRTDHC